MPSDAVANGTTEEEYVSFPESVQRLARQRARGTCECSNSSCPHYGHCRLPAKEFHHKKAIADGGDDELTNCQYFCVACHERAHKTTEELGRI
jgi:5-methylcytosine-specific restriction endonuclease McrA